MGNPPGGTAMSLDRKFHHPVIMGGWASNSKYPFLGSLRSAAQMISYEVSIGLIIIGVIISTGSMNFGDIVQSQDGRFGFFSWYWLPHLPMGFLFFYALIILLMGMILDSTSILLIMVPIAAPIAQGLVIEIAADHVHAGNLTCIGDVAIGLALTIRLDDARGIIERASWRAWACILTRVERPRERVASARCKHQSGSKYSN